MMPFAPGVDAQRGPAGLRESFMLESSVNYRGQTTLPDVVRDVLGLRKSRRQGALRCDRRRRFDDAGPATSRLFGSLKYDGPPVGLEDMERGIAQGATESRLLR